MYKERKRLFIKTPLEKFIKIPKKTSFNFFGKKIKTKEDLFVLKGDPFEEVRLNEAINRVIKTDKLILKQINRIRKKNKGG